MIQVYADGILAYDSRLEDYGLTGLSYTEGLNKGGTATITMPPGHPAYDNFTSYKTVVTIYRDAELLFRGRALYPTDNFQKVRTITCEGERCFLRDGVMRPYLYQDAPVAIFADVIALYNAQVEEFKQFVLGEVTVTDPNNYVRLENESAEQVLDTIDKLVDRCGGYIVFTTNAEGRRVINWYAELGYRSSQTIEFGENLLDYAASSSSPDLATVLIPYGAKDQETGERLTIESVNDGLDFIQDYDAVTLRGVIAKPMYWDDITDPANLKRKAEQELNKRRLVITTLNLTALDLHQFDKNVDSFQLGDLIRVRSRQHQVDDDYELTDRSVDLLNPEDGKVTMGKELKSLTGADVAGDRKTISELHQVERSIRADYQLNIAASVEAVKQTFTSLIQQTSEELRLEVSETYATNDQVTSAISTTMTQLSDSFNFLFTELERVVDGNDATTREQFATIEKYIRFVDGNIILGEEGNELVLHIENDRISFIDAGAEVAYFSNKQLVVLDGHFLHSLQVGAFAWLPRENGNLSLVRVGG